MVSVGPHASAAPAHKGDCGGAAGAFANNVQAGARHSVVIDDLGQVHFFGRQLSECCSIMMRKVLTGSP